jgi:hypothetical protein
MNQKEAVFQAVKELKHGEVDTDKAVALTKREKHMVEEKLFNGFKKGRIAYNNELPSDDKLLLYISGLVSNWLRKDKRLNGQKNYVPQHPRTTQPAAHVEGSGSIDANQLEALRALASSQDSEEVQIFVVKRSITPALRIPEPVDKINNEN